MPDVPRDPDAPVDIDSLVLIVVGAHLRAELVDRPLGYRLRERILRSLDAHAEHASLLPVVCTDLWYLNASELMDRPAISIGDPGVNAASALLSTQLPTAFVIEGTLRIHLDPDFLDHRACLWGVDHSATLSAVDLFAERFLDHFIENAIQDIA